MTDLPSDLQLRYEKANPKSLNLFERSRSSMPGVVKGAYFYRPFPLTIERGDGCILRDVDGHKYLDFANHHTAQILGHNHPAVIDAIHEQLKRGIAVGAPMGIETKLAEEICERVRSVERIRFCNSGTEATLHAIRLARGFSGRPKIAKFEGGFHGTHDVVEISVAPPLDKAGPESAPNSVPTAGGISPHAADEVVVLPYDNEAAVEQLVSQHRDDLACVIFDTKAGILAPRPEFVQAVREITEKHNVLLILDEIVSFRVGRGGFQQQCGISPDLTTFGKIIGGGFPIGAVGGRADIMNLFDNTGTPTGFFQSGTFSAHPVAMAAGLATLEQLDDKAFAHLETLGNRLRNGLNDLFERKQIVAQAIGIGSLFSVYFTDEKLTNYRALVRSNKENVHTIFLSLLEQGFYLSHPLSMNALSFPMTDDHVDRLIDAFGKTIPQ